MARHLILDAATARSAAFSASLPAGVCVRVQIESTREPLKCLPFLFGAERESISAAAPLKYKHGELPRLRSAPCVYVADGER